MSRRPAPPPPIPAREISESSQLAPQRTAPAVPYHHQMHASSHITENITDNIRVMCMELMSRVSHETKLNDLNSAHALELIFQYLTTKLQNESEIINKLQLMQLEFSNCKKEFDKSFCDSSAAQLASLFKKLEACKDDSQQRSWFLHEDEQLISKLLNDIIDILNKMEKKSSLIIASADHFSPIHSLVLYYQMEMRTNLRKLLLQLFEILCHVDVQIKSELLHSVLPLEIARDLQGNIPGDRFNTSVQLLTLLFSSGENLPIHYYDYLNESFVNFLIDRIESPSDDDDEQTAEYLVALVLSFNLHFVLPEENFVVKTVSNRSLVTTFSQILLLFFNRGDDPVHEHLGDDEQHSVLKFLADIYSSISTSAMFYTNDAKVLVDILIRQLSDLPAGTSLRREHLSLAQLMFRNSDYKEYRHRCSEFVVCFRRILSEPDLGDMDKRILQEIAIDLPEVLE